MYVHMDGLGLAGDWWATAPPPPLRGRPIEGLAGDQPKHSLKLFTCSI